jgi:tyrosyl-tRNA synthetase
MIDPKKQFKIIERGTAEIISREDLEKKLVKKRPLIVKSGYDPSAPDIHLGHTVVLRKMRQFQDMGHRVVFLIGDFTGLVGDPTGKDKTRQPLTKEEVEANAQTYKEQVGKILNLETMELVFNSEWLGKLKMEDILKMSSLFTIARMLEHNTFKTRFQTSDSIRIHELFYPFLQGYDSVALKSDIELGGTDQTFNLTFGRDMQKYYDQEPQVAITVPILTGLDGRDKMSKSLGNYVGIDESPQSMYHKLFNLPDTLAAEYFELLTDVDMTEVRTMEKQIKTGKTDPRKVKEKLALEIVSQYHGKDLAEQARSQESMVHAGSAVPDDTPVYECDKKTIWIVELMVKSGLYKTNGEARRLIQGGGVKIDRKKITDVNAEVEIQDGILVQAGKRKFLKVVMTQN